MKKFFAGLMAGVVLMTCMTAFAETKRTIDAIFGQVKLVVDGMPVDKETLLYNGTTYVPLRAAAEVLGMEVGWNGSTNTASLTSKPAVTSTPTPAPTPAPTPTAVKKDLPFTISKIEYTLDVLPPNSIGTVYMQTWYGNRTGYTITYFSLKWFDKGARQNRYLSSSQQVQAGGVSDSFRGFGPESGSLTDIELLETQVTFLNKEGKNVYLTYDHKTKEYTVSGNW